MLPDGYMLCTVCVCALSSRYELLTACQHGQS